MSAVRNAILPVPPLKAGRRSQAEAFLVLRRNPLELWGPDAYRHLVLPGRFLGRQQLLLNDPAAIRHVLLGNHENYQRSEPTRRVLRPVLGEGLFLAEGEAWRHQRRVIAPSLAPRVMPILVRHILRVCDVFEAELRARIGHPVELLSVLQRLTLDIAGQSMFSLEMGRFGPEMRALMLRYALNYAKVGVLDLMLPGHVRSPLGSRPRAVPCRLAGAHGPHHRVPRCGDPGRRRASRPARPAACRPRPGDRRGLQPRAAARRGLHLDPGRARDHRGLAVLGVLHRRPPARAPGAPGAGPRPRRPTWRRRMRCRGCP